MTATLRPSLVHLRTPGDGDWPAILLAVNAAAPWKVLDNLEWVRQRKAFPETRYPRRHYVAENTITGKLLAYGAIEGAEQGCFRVLLAMSPELVKADLAALLYKRLMVDLKLLRARMAWAREEEHYHELIAFLCAQGFCETHRFQLGSGTSVVVLQRELC